MGVKKRKNKVKRNSKEIKKSFFTDKRFKVFIGIIMTSFAAILLLALISYLFTWKNDQSFLWDHVFSNATIKVENLSGKFGEYMSDFLINRCFGIASFSIPFILVLLGLQLLNIKISNLFKIVINIIIGTILLSVTLGFIFGNLNGALGSGLGGRHGLYVSLWLEALIGKTGTVLFILVVLIGYILFTNKSTVDWIRSMLSSSNNKNRYEDNSRRENSDKVPVKEIITDNSEDDLVFETEFPQREATTEEPINQKKDAVSNENVELTVEPRKENNVDEAGFLNAELEDYDPTLELSSYKLPPLDILEKHDEGNSTVTNEELIDNKNKIVETLAHYKIQIDKIKATIGPTVTLYEIVPAPGVRISKIKNLEDDIALNLAALGIRIIAPIPGKGTIGIEVPNQTPEIVSMRSILSSRKFQESEYDLAIAIGKTISNETYVFDLAKMPHLLVAGATGQGKSVGLNAIITSLLYRKHPAQIKFVLVDPKKVELTLYTKIEKHFLAKIPDTDEAIITDTQKVIYTLNSLTIEMDQRYELLKKAQVRNIKEYNKKFIKRRLNPEKGHRYMPYIVVIIDEFADLIMTAGREVEIPLARLAQLARAIGIHLVIATQRPTTNILTGVIKANFPARIAFRVTSMIDSRTILDSPGANQLVGRGDMLLAPGSEMIRLQCAFIDIPEIEKITDSIFKQPGYPTPFYLPEYVDESAAEIGEVDLSKKDNLFSDAARLVVTHQQGSTSLIQRKFSIGYNRAGRIMDQLEAAGIVGPPEGSKPRQVLFPEITSLEQYLYSLDNK